MRVCIVTPDFPIEGCGGRGGAATYSETLATALVQQGVEVHVVVYGNSLSTQPSQPALGLHLHFIELPWVPYFSSVFPGLWQSARLAWYLRVLDQQYRFDVFEMYNDEGVTLFAVVLFKNRVVFRMHSSIRQHIVHKGERFNWRRSFSVWLDQTTARSARHPVTHSEFHSTEMAEEYGLERSQIVVIPHCAWSESCMTPTMGNLVVAYIGSLDRRKGIDVLLKAAPIILSSCPSARLLLIGRDTGFTKDKPWKQWFEDTYGPDPRVDFAGFVSDENLKRLWECIGILVVPSRYESFGLAVIEGFSRAIPVVTTRAAALPEVAGDCAVLVEPGDSIELAEVVIGLLEDPPRAERIAAQGYERYLKLYTPEIFGERIMNLYNRVAGSSNTE